MTDEAPTFPTAPPERIALGGRLALVRSDPELAPAAVAAINASLDHLRPWMAWAAEPATEAGLATFFGAVAELWERRQDFHYSIVDEGTGGVAGGSGLHPRLGIHGLEIGYWVAADRANAGIATAASRALTDAAFTIDDIERVRIQCAEANVRSARVPEKLGFTFHGVQVPADGACAGRPTQVWMVERAGWVTGAAAARS